METCGGVDEMPMAVAWHSPHSEIAVAPRRVCVITADRRLVECCRLPVRGDIEGRPQSVQAVCTQRLETPVAGIGLEDLHCSHATCCLRDHTGIPICWGRAVRRIEELGITSSIAVSDTMICGLARGTGTVACFHAHSGEVAPAAGGVFFPLSAEMSCSRIEGDTSSMCAQCDDGSWCWRTGTEPQCVFDASVALTNMVDSGRALTCGVDRSNGRVVCAGQPRTPVDWCR
jgi:hypothetical protein